MKRRDLLACIGGAAALPFAARAQPAIPVIGVLGSSIDAHLPAFHRGLAEQGFVEGRNCKVEYRWADGRVERYPALAVDLIRSQVTVIASLGGIPAATAAKAATATIPVVFQGGFDPVELGLVASLSRPGGNLTGATNLGAALGSKRLEVLRELLPAATVVGLIFNPDHPNAPSQSRDMQAAARALGLQLRIGHARTVSEFDGAFASVIQQGAAGVVLGVGQPLTGSPAMLGELAARHAIPAIFEFREFVEAGGLVSYSGSRADSFRLVGVYIGRILKGEKPADLPVQQPTKVELIINLKTAKALGIKVPLPLLGRADEVIE